MRILLVLVLACFSSQVIGLSRACQDACAEECDLDAAASATPEHAPDAGDNCPPDCADCCSVHRVLVASADLDLRTDVSECSLYTPRLELVSADPREILHVPRRLLA